MLRSFSLSSISAHPSDSKVVAYFHTLPDYSTIKMTIAHAIGSKNDGS